MAEATTDRERIACRIDGEGPRVLLLHPIGLDMTFWDAVAERLAREFTVMRLDMRGHGSSPPARPGARLADYARDIHDALAAHDFAPTAVVGLSFGGMLAQTLALNHPQDVSALVVCGCTATFPQDVRATLRARGMAARAGGMTAVADDTLARWFGERFLAEGRGEPVRVRLLAQDVDGWVAGWDAISHHDAAPRLGEITVPTLCIAGERDAAAPVAALQAIADAVPGGRLAVLQDAPHMMQIECPRAFADTVARFLGDAHTIRS